MIRICLLEAKTELLKMGRMPSFVVPTLVFPAMFYLLFAVAFGGGSPAATTMLATYGTFGVLGASLLGFGVGVATERGQGWLLLRRALPAPIGAWLAAKLVLSLTAASIIALLLSVLGATLGRVHLAWVVWLELFGVLVLVALPFSALGLALGWLAGPNSAPALVNVVYLPLAFCSGLWVPVEVFPSFLKSAAVVLPPYHAAQLALGVLDAGRGGPAWSHVLTLAGFALAALAVALVAWRRDEGKTHG